MFFLPPETLCVELSLWAPSFRGRIVPSGSVLAGVGCGQLGPRSLWKPLGPSTGPRQWAPRPLPQLPHVPPGAAPLPRAWPAGSCMWGNQVTEARGFRKSLEVLVSGRSRESQVLVCSIAGVRLGHTAADPSQCWLGPLRRTSALNRHV